MHIVQRCVQRLFKDVSKDCLKILSKDVKWGPYSCSSISIARARVIFFFNPSSCKSIGSVPVASPDTSTVVSILTNVLSTLYGKRLKLDGRLEDKLDMTSSRHQTKATRNINYGWSSLYLGHKCSSTNTGLINMTNSQDTLRVLR